MCVCIYPVFQNVQCALLYQYLKSFYTVVDCFISVDFRHTTVMASTSSARGREEIPFISSLRER